MSLLNLWNLILFLNVFLWFSEVSFHHAKFMMKLLKSTQNSKRLHNLWMQIKETKINIKDRKHQDSKLTSVSGGALERREFKWPKTCGDTRAGEGSEGVPISLPVVSTARKPFGFLSAALVRVKSHSAICFCVSFKRKQCSFFKRLSGITLTKLKPIRTSRMPPGGQRLHRLPMSQLS